MKSRSRLDASDKLYTVVWMILTFAGTIAAAWTAIRIDTHILGAYHPQPGTGRLATLLFNTWWGWCAMASFAALCVGFTQARLLRRVRLVHRP